LGARRWEIAIGRWELVIGVAENKEIADGV
jgi:hypothetical protein